MQRGLVTSCRMAVPRDRVVRAIPTGRPLRLRTRRRPRQRPSRLPSGLPLPRPTVFLNIRTANSDSHRIFRDFLDLEGGTLWQITPLSAKTMVMRAHSCAWSSSQDIAGSCDRSKATTTGTSPDHNLLSLGIGSCRLWWLSGHSIKEGSAFERPPINSTTLHNDDRRGDLAVCSSRYLPGGSDRSGDGCGVRCDNQSHLDVQSRSRSGHGQHREGRGHGSSAPTSRGTRPTVARDRGLPYVLDD